MEPIERVHFPVSIHGNEMFILMECLHSDHYVDVYDYLLRNDAPRSPDSNCEYSPDDDQEHQTSVITDNHVQLRFQSYSLLLCTRCCSSKKYYEPLFLGILDMTVVNAYVIHGCISEKRKKKKMSHFDFLDQLHESLIATSETTSQRHLTNLHR